jgi:4-hydroxybenzoyl-CoA thioesterase
MFYDRRLSDGLSQPLQSLAMLESRFMFEARYPTYWADFDAAGIVFFPHFFRFVTQAEEDLFREAGLDRVRIMHESQVSLPRVEAFARFSKPIRNGAIIRVQLNPQIQGQKTIRYNFVILDDQTSERVSEGYVTAVCVDVTHFKATPIPEAIRKIIEQT